MSSYQVTTECDYKIENQDQLENWKTIRSTLVPYQLPGETKQVRESQVDIDDIENLEESTDELHKCPRRPCISSFVRPERLEAHLQAGICKIYAPATTQTLKERVTLMYISAFGTSFYEKFNCRK